MLKGLSEYLSPEVMCGILAASGGIARIVVGTSNDPKTSLCGEVARILFVAMPVGIFAGLYVQAEYSSTILPFAASFTAGVCSLNIVRFLLSADNIKLIRDFIGGRFSGK